MSDIRQWTALVRELAELADLARGFHEGGIHHGIWRVMMPDAMPAKATKRRRSRRPSVADGLRARIRELQQQLVEAEAEATRLRGAANAYFLALQDAKREWLLKETAFRADIKQLHDRLRSHREQPANGRLDAKTADKLAKLLGMTGSEHAGERASAAAQAEALRKRTGKSWAEILGGG